jgi:hypothetical protein
MFLNKIRGFWRGSRPLPPGRRSPQGWTDQQPNWPKNGPARPPFASPWEAVDLVEKSLHNFRTIEHRVGGTVNFGHDPAALARHVLELFSLGLQVLSFYDSEIAPRKGTFGRLVHILLDLLPDVPDLVKIRPYNEQISYLAEDLQYSGDSDLAEEGRCLEAVLKSLAYEGSR